MPASLNLSATGPVTVSKRIYQLHIALQHLAPQVWRRVLVPEGVKLKKLALIIQVAMGWGGNYQHEFLINGQRYGIPDGWNDDPNLLEERRFTLNKVLGGAGFVFDYQCDHGDNWAHRIEVERVESATPLNNWVLCIGGENACPPEDVGGVCGHQKFCAVMADPSHLEYAHYWVWNGGPYDSRVFDINLANQRLKKLP